MSPADSENPNPSTSADELLVVRCQLGESAAFEDLISRWHRPLWQYIRRMTGRDADAQDVLQDVWLRVIRGMAGLRDGSRAGGWLFGIARRVLMDRLRRQYAMPEVRNIDHEDVIEPEPDNRENDLEALDAVLEALPLLEREVLTLFYLRDLSLSDIADALSIPTGTVKSRLFRARRMARAAMREEVQS